MMNYSDIFFTILYQLNFLNSFFFEQYILDLSLQVAFNMHTKQEYSLSSFLEIHNLHIPLNTMNPCTFSENFIILASKQYSQYRILLKINTVLSYFPPYPDTFISDSHIPMHRFTNLNHLLKSPSNQNSYILYFDFITNQNLETPDMKKWIFDCVSDVFKNEICYFQQHDFHHYYMLLKDIDEMQIFIYCETLKNQFQNHSKIYVLPRFLLVECHNFFSFDNLLHKMKQYFYQSDYPTSLLLVKEKVDDL